MSAPARRREGHGVAPDFADDGRPQAMRERCSTCILRPGGSSLVPPKLVRDLVARHRKVGAVVVCHSTLPDITGNHHDATGYVACRGFLDAYPETPGAAIVEPLFGGWHLIDSERTDG